MKRIKYVLVAVAGLALAGLVYYGLFVFPIKEIRVQLPMVEAGYTLIRYTEDVEETIEAKVRRTGSLASEKLTYQTGDPEVAEVTAEGTLIAKKAGVTTVTVKSKGNPFVKKVIPVTVIQKALSMQVSMPEELPSNEFYYLAHTGDRPVLQALPDPVDGLVENLTYESSNPEIVTVSEDGVLEAHQGGIAKISVSWVGPYTEAGKQEDLGSFWVNVCRKQDHDKLEEHEIQWYEESCLIAHALGNAGNETYTNTKDALEESIAEGYKILEVDLNMTSDKEVVCRHTWYSDDFGVSYDGRIPDLATFEKEKYFGTLTTLTGRELLNIWAEHPELYFVTDVKQDENTNLSEVMDGLVALAKEQGQESLLDHLIIQLYGIEDYDRIREIYPFRHWLFTTYQLPDTPGAEIEAAAFSQEKDFGAFTSPVWCMGDDYFVNLANEYDLNLFIHVIDTEEEAERSMKRGIYGFYTDFMSPAGLREAREN
ncbi:glycerophosphodiester phosphodiesterase family protein [Candidatus Merdisoma sp. HCP28S3_D10]|uniref:glycerophosphodiester phosphodiesterase family protein n=1 Tax=unclassified Candidatus Merdisoma TaxID=3099611 RepID=UPI003F894E29